ncbi:flippase-like domain-containing protein [Skermanella mucosa]|uniref:lysylphosphatidylglycerol synthase transmembrane domain-containing protein n=1 Tax=Skermanella mucosa TaxID=1789672 RepID=UPI00192CE35E|nr:lysylphosphatidylglycerol synthase transmembrane domain-containing protein [Skermanella mucosa]UEM20139.1 flippase-like domain-containing protein [Skermanella mucosa]
MNDRLRRFALAALRFALSGLLLWLLLRQTDLEALAGRLAGVDPLWLAAAFALTVVQVVLISWRWAFIMAGLGAAIGTARALRINLAAFFLGQALPTSIAGDVWRVWRLRALGHGVGTAVRGVLVDRTTALLGLVAVVLATGPALLARMPDPAMRWGLLAGLGIGIALLALALTADRLPGRWLPGRLAGVAEFGRTVRGLLARPLTAVPIVGVSALVHLLAGATMWLIARGLDVPVGLVDCLVLMPPIVLVAGMPLSIAGWGLREGAVVAVFGLAGVPVDGALLMSILFGAMLLLVSLPGGLFLALGETPAAGAALSPRRAGSDR